MEENLAENARNVGVETVKRNWNKSANREKIAKSAKLNKEEWFLKKVEGFGTPSNTPTKIKVLSIDLRGIFGKLKAH